jgi:hypothetical protein
VSIVLSMVGDAVAVAESDVETICVSAGAGAAVVSTLEVVCVTVSVG